MRDLGLDMMQLGRSIYDTCLYVARVSGSDMRAGSLYSMMSEKSLRPDKACNGPVWTKFCRTENTRT